MSRLFELGGRYKSATFVISAPVHCDIEMTDKPIVSIHQGTDGDPLVAAPSSRRSQ